MVRDLVELAVDMVKEERLVEVREKAREAAEERVLDLLLPPLPPAPDYDDQAAASANRRSARARNCASSCARGGSITSRSRSTSGRRAFRHSRSSPGSSVEEVDINVKDMLPGSSRARRGNAG